MKAPIPLIGDFTPNELTQWINALQQNAPNESFLPLEALTEQEKNSAQLAVVANPKPELLNDCPNLIWVHSLWAGVEKLANTFKHSHIKLVRLIDPALADSMAEAVLTWCLYLHRNMHLYKHQEAERIWQQHPYIPASQRTIAVLGLGALGELAAKRLTSNNFHVIGWSRSPKSIEGVRCYSGAEELDVALTQADIIVCLLPLTDETHHLFNASCFKQLKKNSCLINFARGPIVDDTALLNALDTQQIEHAVLDVFYHEPLPSDHRYWNHPKITVLPHISAQTRPETASKIVAANIASFRQTGAVPASVNMARGY